MGAENPDHYKSHPSGIECIQVIYPLTYGAASAIKYLWRCGMKDSDVQELTKAMWFIKHAMDADLLQPRLPFDSKAALQTWFNHEPEGYRRDAILAVYYGQYNSALDTIKLWAGAIAGEPVEEPPVPTVNTQSYKAVHGVKRAAHEYKDDVCTICGAPKYIGNI